MYLNIYVNKHLVYAFNKTLTESHIGSTIVELNMAHITLVHIY